MAQKGRPKLPQEFVREVFPLRLSPQEKALFEAAATVEHQTLPQWIRYVLTKRAQELSVNGQSGPSRNQTDR